MPSKKESKKSVKYTKEEKETLEKYFKDIQGLNNQLDYYNKSLLEIQTNIMKTENKKVEIAKQHFSTLWKRGLGRSSYAFTKTALKLRPLDSKNLIFEQHSLDKFNIDFLREVLSNEEKTYKNEALTVQNETKTD